MRKSRASLLKTALVCAVIIFLTTFLGKEMRNKKSKQVTRSEYVILPAPDGETIRSSSAGQLSVKKTLEHPHHIWGIGKGDTPSHRVHFISSTSGEDSVHVKRAERRMKERQQMVKAICNKYNIVKEDKGREHSAPLVKHPPAPNTQVFYFDRKDKLAWCPVYKAASTSWLHSFLKLAGWTGDDIAKEKRQLSEVVREVWPELEYEEALEALNDSFTFIIVRHPFERILSAYRDKLEDINSGVKHGTHYFYNKYGRYIVDKYRQSNVNAHDIPQRYVQDVDMHDMIWQNNDYNLNVPIKGNHMASHEKIGPNITEEEIPQKVKQDFQSSANFIAESSRVGKKEPTFSEFVDYLINTDLSLYADDHWIPYYLYCTPCFVEFDAIAKFETLSEDQEYIIAAAKIKEKVKLTWKHLTKGEKTFHAGRRYFSALTRDQVLNLYEKYKLDFELFGYSRDEYIIYSKH